MVLREAYSHDTMHICKVKVGAYSEPEFGESPGGMGKAVEYVQLKLAYVEQ